MFVHLLTASGGAFCVLGLIFIHHHQWIKSFWALAACLMIDSIDGTLARKFKVNKNIPQIDGALLDNLIDYISYVIVPCFFIYVKELIPDSWNAIIITMIIISSSYQFSHSEAKTKDNFFRGFPSFWNITVFYMFLVNGSKLFNLSIFIILITLVFIPIKYIYISRMNYVTDSYIVKYIIYISSFIFGISAIHLLVFYPTINHFCLIYSFIYFSAYILFSLYKTINPYKRKYKS